MATSAKVTSIEALQQFRGNLVTYLEKAGSALEEVSSEVSRTRAWLQSEQPIFWTREIRRRQRQLDLAEQEMMSARLSRYGKPNAKQVEVVRRYKRALKEAEEKAKTTKAWNRNFESTADPLKRQVDKLQNYFDAVMPGAVHWLDQAIGALAAYAETRPAASGANRASGDSDSSVDESEEEVFAPSPETPKTDDDEDS